MGKSTHDSKNTPVPSGNIARPGEAPVSNTPKPAPPPVKY